MRTTLCIATVLLVGMLALVGCGKSEKPKPSATVTLMDMTPVLQTFPTPTPEVQGHLNRARMALRYRQFDSALDELGKLAQTPNLTEPQKKALDDKIAQIKQAATTAAAEAAKPAQ